MKLLYGKSVAQEILSRLKNDISLREQKPGLAVILVGSDKASQLYVALKERTAKEIGMNFFRYDFSQNVSQEEILQQIEKLNNDANVNGVIVQLPLPAGYDTQKIIASIDPKKDADGFSAKGAVSASGARSTSDEHPELVPVFPKAIIKLIESSEQNLVGKKAVSVVNSELFGQTMVEMLGRENVASEYVLAENILSNLEKIKASDIVVSAVGSPGLLRGEMFKDGSIIIDGGIEKVGEQVFGDVDFASTEGINGHITPVPGGVGPVTIACLLENVYLAFEAQQKEEKN